MSGLLHALLIDDNPDDRALVQRELERSFGRIRTTPVIDAPALDAALTRGEFDLVITDFQLRWTDGLHIVRTIRHRYPDCPMVMYTGTGNEEVAAAAMKIGLDEYVVKSANRLPQLRLAATAALERAVQRRALREQQERTQAILDTVVDGIVTIDEKGLIQSFNPAAERLFGYSADELIGENIKILMPEPYSAEHDGYIANYLKTGTAKIIGIGREMQGRTKDGRLFPMELAVNEMRLSNGKRHFIGSVRDLTERNRLEEQLRNGQKMEAVGQLTGGLAHDFNNILTVILGNLELATERAGADPGLCSVIELAHKAGERGAALIRRLLTFSRRHILQSQALTLNEVVNDLLDMLSHSIGDNIKIKTTSGKELWHVLADKNQVENVVLNLAINARDAMPAGGTLTIDTRNVRVTDNEALNHPQLKVGEYVRLSVTDIGSGMPPEVIARAFEPFFTTKDVGKGTGLGLSMVYGFAQQSRGHVVIDSEIGTGTTVHFYLPRCHRCAAQPVAEPEGELVTPRKEETILVVEDDDLVRSTVAEQLKRLGYCVLIAANGREAIDILKSDQPIDLLFTDIVMPSMSGRELACESAKFRPDLRIIFTTGHDQSGPRETAVADSEDSDVLLKPYRRQDLARKIRKALDVENKALSRVAK